MTRTTTRAIVFAISVLTVLCMTNTHFRYVWESRRKRGITIALYVLCDGILAWDGWLW